jgi:hypothetical protein
MVVDELQQVLAVAADRRVVARASRPRSSVNWLSLLKPVIAVSGVRSSWVRWLRNSVLRRFASRAASVS